MKNITLFILGIFFANLNFSQLSIDTLPEPEELVLECLIGKRIKAKNIKINGVKGSYCKFRDISPKPLMGEGLMFTTGYVFDARGPNHKANIGWDYGLPGESDLEKLAQYPTYDATGIEFDFVPEHEWLYFNFVFASEEYVEYVNTEFNDVFGFFISGPGYEKTTNLAIVPGRGAPISINTVNHGQYKEFYIENNWFDRRGKGYEDRREKLDSIWVNTFQFDGLTKLIEVRARVQPRKTYHIKIAIADVSDGAYDSAVFLEGKSFTSLPDDLAARARIVASEARQFRRSFEPAPLSDRAPRPGPALLAWEARDDLSFRLGHLDPLDPSTTSFPAKPARPKLPDLTAVTVNGSASEPVEPLSPEVDQPPAKGPVDPGWKLLITFDFDSDKLDLRAQMQLEAALMHLNQYPEKSISLSGHTCDMGSRGYNQDLSERRAQAVEAYLVKAGRAAKQIRYTGFNYEKPSVSNTDEAHRALNRRVELRWAD